MCLEMKRVLMKVIKWYLLFEIILNLFICKKKIKWLICNCYLLIGMKMFINLISNEMDIGG